MTDVGRNSWFIGSRPRLFKGRIEGRRCVWPVSVKSFLIYYTSQSMSDEAVLGFASAGGHVTRVYGAETRHRLLPELR